MRRLLWALALLAAAVAGLWAAAPRDRLPLQAEIRPGFPPDLPVAAIDDWLRAREGVFDDITPGAEKTVVWAGEAGTRTPLALVYLHGFSATRAEIEPVPQLVARALGANLFLTRLTGHGRPGAELARATTTDWALDLDEAVGLGRRLGTRVVLIGTSTGGALAALAARDPALARDLAGIVLISPNFALQNPQAWILDLPFADRWLPLLKGRERAFEPQNPEHARYWTTRYPIAALFPMRAVQRQAGAADYSGVRLPLLVLLAEGDQVVDPAATRRVVAGWGGPARLEVIVGADDPAQHVIAGRILSPSTTEQVAALIAGWIAELGP
jgi:alpha-beta hydrolase superfamily lysophospholipase